jgi:AAA+ superfamily predicted ATPase
MTDTHFKHAKSATKLDDVVENDESKKTAQEIVDFLKNSTQESFSSVSRNTLIVGQSETGKTLLAKTIASEANASLIDAPCHFLAETTFFNHRRTEARVQALFETAKQKNPCIILLDDLDDLFNVCSKDSVIGAEDRLTKEKVRISILTEIEKLTEDDKIAVLATTSRPDMIDDSFLNRFQIILN